MRCPACGHENREGARFCGECRASLQAQLHCPACGQDNPPGQKFCDGCGEALGAGSVSSSSVSPAAPSVPLPASFAAGRYRVERFLGEGAKKRVYLARDTRLNREVAVAVIKSEGLDADGLARVRREAEAMGQLGDHPHVVTVFDVADEVGQAAEGGQVYIVCEYMAGGDVESRLSGAEDHRLPVDEALGIAEQICAALEHAHGRGLIHRDLKPGNVYLSPEGDVRLGDFGLALALDRSRLSQEGTMVGTVSYMPPEQALGRTADARADLYALGAMLYEMVAGRPPFVGDDAVAIISQHINSAPVAPSWHCADVPASLDQLVLRLLAKSPEGRPPSAAAVAEELRRIRERPPEERQQAQSGAASPSIRGLQQAPFVGRREEMDQLHRGLDEALAGRGTLIMLVGEPGIGKSRLTEELGVYAELRGAQVLVGRCYEGDVGLPFRPFVEAFRAYAGSRPDPDLRRELGEGAPEIAQLVSEIRQRYPDLPQAPHLDPDAERLRLFESVTSFVRNVAAGTPLVLVLDDLHWADKPSLLLLLHLARSLAGARVLVVGAYRDIELDRTHPLSEVIATLRREQNYQRILLRGLPEDGVLAWLTSLDSSPEGEAGRHALASALYRETEGNPFFVREVLRHLVEEGKLYREGNRWQANVTSVSELGIPEGVREVVGRRLSRLGEACNRMLTQASLLTRGFTWDALVAITGEREEALLDLLDEALNAQLIEERRDRPGRYDFTHALIRQTLYGELSTPRRVLMHRRIGEALEGLYADHLEPHLGELAHHFYQAAPGGDVEKAIDYARRAGERATDQLAYEDAAAHYELALQALELQDRSDERTRYELLLAQGNAYARADVPERAAEVLRAAVRSAEQLRDTELQAAATVTFATAAARGPLFGSQTVVAAVEKALGTLGSEESALGVQLLAQLVNHRVAGKDFTFAASEEDRAVARRAREIADRLGDPQARDAALNAMYNALWAPDTTEEQLALTDDWVRVTQELGEDDRLLWARVYRMRALAELGRMGEVDREMERIFEIADRMREPAYTAWRPVWGCMRAAMQGRYAEAEQRFFEAFPIAQRMQHPGVLAAAIGQLFHIRRATGQLAELLVLMDKNPTMDAQQAALALAYFETGDELKAREWFERLAEHDFRDLARGGNYLVTLMLAADLTRGFGDERRARLLYDMLLPYAGRNVTVGIAHLCEGSASRPLGKLAATMRRWDDAARHFEEALEFNERIEAWPWLARTRYEYARMLAERGRREDLERALELLNRALEGMEEMGMKKEVEWALELKLELQGVSSGSIRTTIDTVTASVERRRPDLHPHAAPDGTVTLVFSDVEGFTPMTERLGDVRAREVIRHHNALVREQLTAHGGYEVELQGDGFLLAFASARRALQCAVGIQRALAAYNARHPDEPVRVRIGLHTGEALKDADGFFGKAVILASRIAAQAKGEQILVSALLKQLVEAGGDIRFGDARELALKGISDPQRVYDVLWQ